MIVLEAPCIAGSETREARRLHRDDRPGIVVWTHRGRGNLIGLWNGWAWISFPDWDEPQSMRADLCWVE